MLSPVEQWGGTLPLHVGEGAPRNCWTSWGEVCLVLYNSQLPELVKTLNMNITWWAEGACVSFCLSVRASIWEPVFVLLSLCPLHIRVTWPFRALRGTWSQNFSDLLMLPLRCFPLRYPVTPGLHSWKSRRGWVEYPWWTSPKAIHWTPLIKVYEAEFPGGTGWDDSLWRVSGWQSSDHVSHSSPSRWKKWSMSSYPESVVPVSVSYRLGYSKGVCGSVPIWHTHISNATLTVQVLLHRPQWGRMRPDSNWESYYRITATPACPFQAANCHATFLCKLSSLLCLDGLSVLVNFLLHLN